MTPPPTRPDGGASAADDAPREASASGRFFVAGPSSSDADEVRAENTPCSRFLPLATAPVALEEALARASRVWVAAHQRPDGDAAGSAIGLVRILRALGVEAFAVGLAPVAEPLRFLTGPTPDDPTPPVLPDDDPRLADTAPGACVVALDCAAPDRLPTAARALANRWPLYVIDHHASNPGYGALDWIAPDASSTGEMVAVLAFHAGWTIPPAAADALWTAILTDTGRFTHANTAPGALLMSAYLVDCGARPAAVADHVFRSTPLAALKLAGRLIDDARFDPATGVAWGGLTRGDFTACHAGVEHAQDLIDHLRSLDGVAVALFFCELGDDVATGQVKVGVRTQPPYDATVLAARFGGGGHARAAGFSLRGVSMAEAHRQVGAALAATWLDRATPLE